MVSTCHSCNTGELYKTKGTYVKRYKGVQLYIIGLPVERCTFCEEVLYKTGSMSRAIKQAKARYDESGMRYYLYPSE